MMQHPSSEAKGRAVPLPRCLRQRVSSAGPCAGLRASSKGQPFKYWTPEVAVRAGACAIKSIVKGKQPASTLTLLALEQGSEWY